MIIDKITTTKEETMLILSIVKRSESLGVCYGDRLTRMMDMEVVHSINPLRLEDMLNGSAMDLLHDIYGIAENLNRETGELENCFSPRYTK